MFLQNRLLTIIVHRKYSYIHTYIAHTYLHTYIHTYIHTCCVLINYKNTHAYWTLYFIYFNYIKEFIHTYIDRNIHKRKIFLIQSNIINHVYDVVIVGSGHVNRYKHGLRYRDLPFYDLVCKHYHPNEVAILDGFDWPTTNFLIMRYVYG